MKKFYLEPENRQQEWTYYDLERAAQSGWAAVYYLENMKGLVDTPVEDVVPA